MYMKVIYFFWTYIVYPKKYNFVKERIIIILDQIYLLHYF